MATVKTPRSYDSTRRRAQARQNRDAVLDAAGTLFLRNGYAATTVAAIAAEAGVSVETVYKAFGNKPGLVRALADAAMAGPGAVPTMNRSDEMSSREVDPNALVRKWAAFTVEVTPRLAPVVLLIRAAATGGSAEMTDLLARLDAERLDRMTHQAEFLRRRGFLRPDVSVTEARDVMWAYTDPAMFELLVLRQGWSLPRYQEFLAAAFAAALLP
jgi:AcrR family transcriptional regulator